MTLGFLVFYPMLGALLIWGIGLKNEKLRDYLADFLVLSELAVMVILFAVYGE